MTQIHANMLNTIYAVQHAAFADLGLLEDMFYQWGYRVRYVEAGIDDLKAAFAHPGLTVILGGPIAVYDTEDYPFLSDEIALLKQRLQLQLPTLGICLGAQLIARALGAKVYAGPQKEIGWSTLSLVHPEHNILAPLVNTPVLHWHGDTFDLPEQASLLAGSALYPHQAFSVGRSILGLQFHIEVSHECFERWLISHCYELKQDHFSLQQLRADYRRYNERLTQQSALVIQKFLEQLGFELPN